MSEIRRRVDNGESQTAVARSFDIKQPVVSRIIIGQAYAGFGDGPVAQKRKRQPNLPAHTALEIRRRVDAGERQAAVARDLGIKKSVVNRIATGRTHKE